MSILQANRTLVPTLRVGTNWAGRAPSRSHAERGSEVWTAHRPPPTAHRPRRGFTLVELLITVTVIAIMAGIVMGALQMAREEARAAKTKATIAKLDHVIMQKYESYLTRRVPVDMTGLSPQQAAQVRLTAIRYLMMMEMPERFNDINQNAGSGQPISLPGNRTLPWSALAVLYGQRFAARQPTAEYGPAECLYLLVTAGTPEARELFHQSEIADLDGDGWPEFIDGWGMPIMFLRCAPGFSPYSDIQTGDPGNDHDPLDPRGVDPGAYKLTPLIYSAGPDKRYSIELIKDYRFNGNPYANQAIGTAVDEDGKGIRHWDNIHNHHLEVR